MHDLLIIGGGPAGLAALEHAISLGANACLLEASRVGGTDAASGVVPCRTLAQIARLKRQSNDFRRFGLEGVAPIVRFDRALARTRDVVDRVHALTARRIAALGHGVRSSVIENLGPVRFRDPNTVEAACGRSFTARSFIVCAGGHGRRPSFPGCDLALLPEDLWSGRVALPSSAVVVGSGDTGVQVASILRDFGCAVRLVEHRSRMLAHADSDVALAVERTFIARGVEIVSGLRAISSIERAGNGLSLALSTASGPITLRTDAVILSLGWIPNTDGLGVKVAGIELTERGFIKVSEDLQTSQPHIYAAGDVTGGVMLVTAAMQEGYIAAGNALRGEANAIRHGVVSSGGYPYPEYGCVGLTEAEATAAHDCEIVKVGFDENVRAIIDGHTEGFCKLIVDRRSRLLLGAHVVGERAVEIVQLIAAGMTSGLRVEQLAALDLAHPTYMQIVGEAAYRACLAMGVELAENAPVAAAAATLQQPNSVR